MNTRFSAILLLLASTFFLHAADKPVPVAQKPPPKPTGGDMMAMFKMHWISRVDAFKEQNLSFGNVVLLGDSITEGFNVAKHFPGRRVLNRGIGADIIGNALSADDPRGIMRRLDSSVFDCAPTDLFILIGTNDMGMGHSVDTIEAGYSEMLSRIRKQLPALRIYVQSVLPTRGSQFDKRNEMVNQFNERLKKLAGEFSCTYVDLHSLMVDPEGKLKNEFTKDGLHLTDPGYVVWRQEVSRLMKWQ